MSTAKYTDRVRKLFAKAESTTSEHEAEALLSRAYALLAKYGIEEAAAKAGADTDPSEITTWTYKATGSYRLDQILLVNQVAAALHCSAIRIDRNTLQVFGARRHLDRVEMLGGLLVAHMLATAGRARSFDPRVSTVTYRKSVMLGFIAEVDRRLKAAEETARRETADSTGVAVVLRSDAQAARRAMARAFPQAASSGPVRRSEAGMEAGRRAAADIDLGGSRRVAGQRAIAG